MKNSWNPFSYPPRAVFKSVWGFLLPGLGILLKAYTDRGALTWGDGLSALLTACVVGYGVFAVPNTPPGETTPAEANAEAGFAAIGFIGAVLILVGILAIVGVVHISLAIAVLLAFIGLLLVVLDWRGTRIG